MFSATQFVSATNDVDPKAPCAAASIHPARISHDCVHVATLPRAIRGDARTSRDTAAVSLPDMDTPSASGSLLDIFELATATGGSVTTAQLRALGCSDTRIHDMVRRGYLRRERRGHFVVGHAAMSREATWRSKVRQAGEGAALAGFAAVDCLGFLPWSSTDTLIVVPRPRRPVDGAHVIVRSWFLALGQTCRGGIPTLDPEVALLSVADQGATETTLVRLMREGVHKKVLDLDRLDHLAGVRRIPGGRALRSARACYDTGDRSTWSRFERDVAKQLPSDVLRGSLANAEVPLGRDSLAVDRLWRAEGIVLECDGPPHDQPPQQRIDRICRTALRAHGFQVHVVHWRAFEQDPEASTRSVVAAVRHARWSVNATQCVAMTNDVAPGDVARASPAMLAT